MTAAVFVARLTEAPETPSTRESAFSTRATQEAHVIPSTGKIHLASFPGIPPGGEADGSGGTCRAAQLITLLFDVMAYR